VIRDQAKDTGMAMVLVCLLIAHFGEKHKFIAVAIVVLIVNMVWPGVYRQPARLWFRLAEIMGNIMSCVILTLLFFGLVTPVGIIRKWMGKDPMKRKQWKQGDSSVFRLRDHRYQDRDIENPY